MTDEVEIVPFANPSSRECSLYLPVISWAGEADALKARLRSIFSEYGLLHSVFVKESSSGADGQWFAFLTFYSALQAKRARLMTHNSLLIEKKRVRVTRSRGDDGKKTDLPLSLSKCEELANHFLGFDNWNMDILYHKYVRNSD